MCPMRVAISLLQYPRKAMASIGFSHQAGRDGMPLRKVASQVFIDWILQCQQDAAVTSLWIPSPGALTSYKGASWRTYGEASLHVSWSLLSKLLSVTWLQYFCDYLPCGISLILSSWVLLCVQCDFQNTLVLLVCRNKAPECVLLIELPFRTFLDALSGMLSHWIFIPVDHIGRLI